MNRLKNASRRALTLVFAATFFLCIAEPLVAQPPPSGDLQITFKYLGAPPPPPQALPGVVPIPKVLVNPTNNGLKNVVVYAYTSRRGGMQLPPQNQPRKNVNVTINNRQFDPHITIAQTGDRLHFVNRGVDSHNVNGLFLANAPFGGFLGPGQRLTCNLVKPEPTVAGVQDNIYPWMQAYLLVVDHPFAAVSDGDGKLIIKGLPVGNVKLRAWHENGTFSKRIFDNGVETQWPKNILEFNLKAGLNDYGTVEVPADQLRINW